MKKIKNNIDCYIILNVQIDIIRFHVSIISE